MGLVTKAKPISIQKPSAYLTRSVFRFADPTGISGDQWRMIAREPINRMSKQFIVRELVSIPFIITSADRNDKRPKEYMERWDDIFDNGQGFDVWMARMVDDACTLPFGAISEIGRKGDDLDWVVHVDGATVLPTYEDKVPYVQINPDNWEQRVYFKRNQVERLLVYARPDIRYKEYQVAPTEASFLEIEALSKIYLYYMQQLTDTPPPGILDVMDMTAADAQEWAESFRSLLEGTDPIKIPLLTDHNLAAKFISFGRSPQDLNVVEQFKRFAEMLLAKYGLSIGDLRLFEHESTKAGERVSQAVTERSGIGYWAARMEQFLTNLLPKGLSFQYKQPRPERELVEAQRKAAQLAMLQAATGNKPLISIEDAVEEARALELFLTEVEAAEEPEPQQPQAFGPDGQPLQQPPKQLPETPTTDEEQDTDDDKDLTKAVVELVAKQLGEYDPEGPVTMQFNQLWLKIFKGIGETIPDTFGEVLDKIAAEWQAATVVEEAKATPDLDSTIESILENQDWSNVPLLFEDDLLEILEELYTDGLNTAATEIERLRLGEANLPFMNLDWNVQDPRMIDFVQTHGAEMVQNVDNGTRYYLREMITEMMQEGYPGAHEAVQRIKYDLFGLDPTEAAKLTDNRIRSIVNYEVNRAMSNAGYELRESLGLKLKQWFTSRVNPCDICLSNEAQGIVKSDFQYDGVFGAILYPPAHPQTCHCVTTAVEGEVRALGTGDIVWPFTASEKAWIEKGGAGSGNWGHAGRPGTIGGSAPKGGGAPRAQKTGYRTRNEAVTALGLRDTVHLNSLIKHGMPSIKEGRRRYVKWPEAEQWHNEYSKQGGGAKGIKAANDLLGTTGSGKLPKPPKPPDKPPPDGDPKDKINANRTGDGTLKLTRFRGFGPDENTTGTKVDERRIRKTLSVLPQHHLDQITSIRSATPAEMDRKYGKGWSDNTAAFMGRDGSMGLMYTRTLTSSWKRWDGKSIVHEAGHGVLNVYMGVHRSPKGVSMFGGSVKQRRAVVNDARTLHKTIKQRRAKHVTGYAKTGGFEEWWCESYAHYVRSPTKMRKVDSQTYDYFKGSVFGGQEYTTSAGG